MSSKFAIYLVLLAVGSFASCKKSYKGDSSRTSKLFKLLTSLFLVVFISEVLSPYLAYRIQMSWPVYHCLIPIQCVFQGLIFSEASKKNKKIDPHNFLFGGSYVANRQVGFSITNPLSNSFCCIIKSLCGSVLSMQFYMDGCKPDHKSMIQSEHLLVLPREPCLLHS